MQINNCLIMAENPLSSSGYPTIKNIPRKRGDKMNYNYYSRRRFNPSAISINPHNPRLAGADTTLYEKLVMS